MLRHIIAFEIRYWLRSWMLWIFLLIIAGLIFGAASTDHEDRTARLHSGRP